VDPRAPYSIEEAEALLRAMGTDPGTLWVPPDLGAGLFGGLGRAFELARTDPGRRLELAVATAMRVGRTLYRRIPAGTVASPQLESACDDTARPRVSMRLRRLPPTAFVIEVGTAPPARGVLFWASLVDPDKASAKIQDLSCGVLDDQGIRVLLSQILKIIGQSKIKR